MDEEKKVVPYAENDGSYYDDKKYDTYDYMKDAEEADIKSEPSTAARVLLVLMTVFLNMLGATIGIIVGAVYMGKSSRGYKSYGKMLMILSIVFLIVDIFLWVILFNVVWEFTKFSLFY